VIDIGMDREHLQTLIEEHALARDAMDTTRVQAIREEMERYQARRLQPHFIAAFFLEAFAQLGGTIREREAGRFEITHVPAVIRNRVRRRLRHLVRGYLPSLPDGSLLVVRAHPRAATARQADLAAELDLVLVTLLRRQGEALPR